MNILVTGGAGFIGSHLVRHLVRSYPRYHITNLDALTYAGNLQNLKDIEGASNYNFVQGDIRDKNFLEHLFSMEKFDRIIHLAAESHVDRSILNPQVFMETNALGTMNLLSAALSTWEEELDQHLFYHVSTDEVYGSLGPEGYFSERSSYAPNSPYAASKAAADHMVRAFGRTYGLPVVISNCSNNFGPYQFPEKLIPLVLRNIMNRREIPVYGNGMQVRDWLFVEDHVSAMDIIFHQGRIGDTYIVGGRNERSNLDLIRTLCDLMDRKQGREPGTSENLIAFIKDRPGHDTRYAIDPSKIEKALDWKPLFSFEEALEQTIEWYLNNPDWIQSVTSGAYLNYYREIYGAKDQDAL